mgnify:CR=1 FL=1
MKVIWGKFGTGVDLILCVIINYYVVSIWVNGKDEFHAYSLKTSIIFLIWGKQTGLTDTSGENIGKLNPFRYRAYCYDDDTKLYVTASRYYDLELCRFLCADNFDVVKAEMFKKLN